MTSATARKASSPPGTSRRCRRQYEVCRFSAVRTTQARGAGCLPTVRQDAHARANASATTSSDVSRSPVTAKTVRRQSSRDEA